MTKQTVGVGAEFDVRDGGEGAVEAFTARLNRRHIICQGHVILWRDPIV